MCDAILLFAGKGDNAVAAVLAWCAAGTMSNAVRNSREARWRGPKPAHGVSMWTSYGWYDGV